MKPLKQRELCGEARQWWASQHDSESLRRVRPAFLTIRGGGWALARHDAFLSV
jgi:hypothetical protein